MSNTRFSMKKVAKRTLLPLRKGIPKMATDGNPVAYKGGKIYFSKTKGGFRVIRDASDFATERVMRIARFASVQQAWLHALKAIDDF